MNSPVARRVPRLIPPGLPPRPVAAEFRTSLIRPRSANGKRALVGAVLGAIVDDE